MKKHHARILVAEDNPALLHLLDRELQKAGYECCACPDGGKAAQALEESAFDLAVLDIMLPEIDGYELLSWCNQQKVPVIFLTAKAQVKDRIAGLRAGAEDYVVKPFAVEELITRMEVVLRRYGKGKKYLVWDNLTLDVENYQVQKNGETVELRAREFELLCYLVVNRGMVLSRSRIYEAVWKQEYTGDTRTVDLHIQRLRSKLELGEKLRAVYRLGYMLSTEEQEP